MSHMAVFQLPYRPCIAHPYAPGPAAGAGAPWRGSVPDAVPHHQHGRGRPLDAAARHAAAGAGTRTPAKGDARDPADACGAFIGFVGPE